MAEDNSRSAGPSATVGSIGTGGDSNADQSTGDANENTIEEDVR
jgi:hypothetical protein